MTDTLVYRGKLVGHNGWVTSIATSPDKRDILVTGSRDKSLLVWHLTHQQDNYGYPVKVLKGHNHFVQDVVLSTDGQFALSASWDHSMRLWDLHTGETSKRFVGHGKDVLSVAFSSDNRQIVSGGRDKAIKLWNTLGQCKFTITEDGHKDWVSCVRFSPNPKRPLIVSAGWDKVIKVWNLSTCKLETNLIGHTGQVVGLAVSPDGSLCASGGKDGVTMLWDLSKGEYLYSLDTQAPINALCFSPNRYWLCAATESTVKIWDLETKSVIAELAPETTSEKPRSVPYCISLAWSADGTTLFTGYTDRVVRVWGVSSAQRL